MKKNLILNYLMVICLVFNTYQADAVIKSVPNQNVESIFELDTESLINKTKDELENEIGRKLTFKEKIALKLVKKKLKKNNKLNGLGAIEQVKTDGMAIAGFVTGLVSLFFFGIILGILGIIFSSIALKRIRREPETRKGRGLAIAGLVLGIVGLVGLIIVAAFAG